MFKYPALVCCTQPTKEWQYQRVSLPGCFFIRGGGRIYFLVKQFDSFNDIPFSRHENENIPMFSLAAKIYDFPYSKIDIRVVLII